MKITLRLIKELDSNSDCTWMERCAGKPVFEMSNFKGALYPNSRWTRSRYDPGDFGEVDCEYDYHADDVSRCKNTHCDAFRWFSKNFSEKECKEGVDVLRLASVLEGYISEDSIERINSAFEDFLNNIINYDEFNKIAVNSNRISIKEWFKEKIFGSGVDYE